MCQNSTVYTKVHLEDVAAEGNWISDVSISNSTVGHLHILFSKDSIIFYFSQTRPSRTNRLCLEKKKRVLTKDNMQMHTI